MQSRVFVLAVLAVLALRYGYLGMRLEKHLHPEEVLAARRRLRGIYE